ncbi:MAG: RluA family pseudouridine synthase [Bacteroidales bacterium]|nr:RluA family pseudouridine synthase [Bacteroidales bacterium]MCF8376623.1 RluA family pseudouridine synthase [Bacteroidales bacterium]MCF8400655.1 RluA family pseudouridine synthase [Bacteroidales bacterium]
MGTSEHNQDESRDLYEHHRFDVDPGQSPVRIDKFLFEKIRNASRNKIQLAAKAGNILVNDEAVKPSYKVKPGDRISIVLTYPPRDTEIHPEDIPIEVVYEDRDLLIVNKQAGMVAHPGYNNYTGTLVHALAHYLQKVSPLPNEEGLGFLVHRIDKDTSGLLVTAKNEEAQSGLANQFFHHSIDRKYQALVWGDLENDEGTIEGNIARDKKDRRVMSIYEDEETGKEAITHYKVIKRFRYVTLTECRLETGRTHQIRAHFKHIKHPLFNDAAYGGDRILKGTTFTKYKQFVQNCFALMPRQALHAKSLGFIHPVTKKKMFFDSELPGDFKAVLDKWEHYTEYKPLD